MATENCVFVDKWAVKWYYYNEKKNFSEKSTIGATDGVCFAIYRVKGGFDYERQKDN